MKFRRENAENGGASLAADSSAVRALLAGAIDYAGLFPPARLELDEVLARYREYRARHEAWMLGRLVVPVERAFEVGSWLTASGSQPTSGPGPRWDLSLLVPPSPDAAQTALTELAAQIDRGSPLRIASVEVGIGSSDRSGTAALIGAVEHTFPDAEVYVEATDRGSPIELLLDALADLRALMARGGAKIRLGGTTPGAIPAADEVIRFLRACAERRLPFKATAGLHHPLPGVRALTYDSDAPTGAMHGFLNLLFVAALLLEDPGTPGEQVAQVLGEAEPPEATPEGLLWGGHLVRTAAIARARRHACRSFGSCSFIEPVSGLAALGWIEAGPSAPYEEEMTG